MPAYDYRCHSCVSTATEYPMIADRDLVRCGACGGTMERLFSPPRARPVVVSAYQREMRRHPDMVEVGESRQEFDAEMRRWKREAEAERSERIGQAADELVSELGEVRETVLSKLDGGSRDDGGRTSPPPAPKIPEDWVHG